jgi:hypothetical protein
MCVGFEWSDVYWALNGSYFRCHLYQVSNGKNLNFILKHTHTPFESSATSWLSFKWLLYL